jgi:hypothetical protein
MTFPVQNVLQLHAHSPLDSRSTPKPLLWHVDCRLQTIPYSINIENRGTKWHYLFQRIIYIYVSEHNPLRPCPALTHSRTHTKFHIHGGKLTKWEKEEGNKRHQRKERKKERKKEGEERNNSHNFNGPYTVVSHLLIQGAAADSSNHM